MTIEQRKKLAAHIQRILKVRRVSFPIANTEKGPLYLSYVKDAPDFEIVLDAVPLNMNDYDNRELKSLFEKYLFEKEEGQMIYPILPLNLSEEEVEQMAELGDNGTTTITVEKVMRGDEDITDKVLGPEKKKRGRPAKGK